MKNFDIFFAKNKVFRNKKIISPYYLFYKTCFFHLHYLTLLSEIPISLYFQTLCCVLSIKVFTNHTASKINKSIKIPLNTHYSHLQRQRKIICLYIQLIFFGTHQQRLHCCISQIKTFSDSTLKQPFNNAGRIAFLLF